MMGVALLAGVLAGSCRETTAPRLAVHSIVGTFALTAELKTYTYAVDCAVSCTTATVPSGAASLAGSLVIADSVASASPSGLRVFAHAPLRAVACTDANPRCSATFPERTSDLPGDVVIRPDSTSVEATFSGSGEFITLKGRFAGDSIAGELRWYVGTGRAARWYDGTYVARRVR